MCASSAFETRGCSSGLRYSHNHSASHTNPLAPAAANAPAPRERHHQHGNDHRNQHGADVGAGIEKAGGERALLPGEPLGHGLDAGRKVGRFAESQEKHGDAKGERRGGQAGRHGREAPQHDRDGKCLARPQPVREPSGHHKADRVRHFERGRDISIGDVVPADLLAKGHLKIAENSAVDVGHHRGEEQQAANHPSVSRRGRPFGGKCHGSLIITVCSPGYITHNKWC